MQAHSGQSLQILSVPACPDELVGRVEMVGLPPGMDEDSLRQALLETGLPVATINAIQTLQMLTQGEARLEFASLWGGVRLRDLGTREHRCAARRRKRIPFTQ